MLIYVELFEFVGQSGEFKITPHEVDVEVDGSLYKSTSIERGNLTSGTDVAKVGLEFKLSPDHALVRHLLHKAITGETTVVRILIARENRLVGGWRIYGMHWAGRVLGVEVADDVAIIRCEHAIASIKRIGLRRLYSRTCSHVLYSSACGATPIAASALVTEVNGNTIIFDAIPTTISGKLAGGWLETPDGARHMILKELEYDYGVELLYPVAIADGTTVTLVAGCDHSMATCANRFGNLANYGGFPFIPQKNPFSTGVF